MTRYGLPDSVLDLFSVNTSHHFRKDGIGDDSDSSLSTGGNYNWRFDAMAGNDEILITDGRATLENLYAVNLGAGDDFFLGQGERDVVLGGAGRDQLIGGDGRDKLYGQAGNDYLSNGGGGSYEEGGDILNGGKGNDIYNVSGFATVYDNGGQNNIYNLAQYADANFHLSANSSGVLNIEGDSDDIIFAREGDMLIVGNSVYGTYAYLKHYFDDGETSIRAFTSDDGAVLGPIDLEKGLNESFENLMI